MNLGTKAHYSYIKPRHKSFITSEMKLLFVFFFMTITMLLLTYIFLVFKDYTFENTKAEILAEREQLKQDLERMNAQISYIESQKKLSQSVFTQNTVLKDSISNMFDLVPERITLSEAQLLKNGLILYGITPSKDVYNFMLQAPLRSIFHRTYSSFYPNDNGWLSFVSKNYIDEDEYEIVEKKGDEDEL